MTAVNASQLPLTSERPSSESADPMHDMRLWDLKETASRLPADVAALVAQARAA
jgi:hypothetical protein